MYPSDSTIATYMRSVALSTRLKDPLAALRTICGLLAQFKSQILLGDEDISPSADLGTIVDTALYLANGVSLTWALSPSPNRNPTW